jgi:hypothetical protein
MNYNLYKSKAGIAMMVLLLFEVYHHLMRLSGRMLRGLIINFQYGASHINKPSDMEDILFAWSLSLKGW